MRLRKAKPRARCFGRSSGCTHIDDGPARTERSPHGTSHRSRVRCVTRLRGYRACPMPPGKRFHYLDPSLNATTTMNSTSITLSAASTTPSSTTRDATPAPRNDDRLWPLGLFAIYIFALICCFYLVVWVYDKVDWYAKDRRRRNQQAVEMRGRRQGWELYP